MVTQLSNNFARFDNKASVFREAQAVVVKQEQSLSEVIASKTRLKDTVGRDAVQSYSEMRRIIGLPVVKNMTETEYDVFNRKHILASAYEDNWRLFPVQAQGLRDYQEFGGGFFPIAVGWGKTILSLMIADYAYRHGRLKIMLTIPPNVLDQLVGVQIPEARTKVPLGFPIFIVGNKTVARRRQLVNSDRSGLYIVPYSLLSTTDSVELLIAINPDLIICDEVHEVSKRGAARTKRLFNFIDERQPELVGLSGTITTKSVRDYWHTIKAALGQNCPLPLSSHMANDWAAVLDSNTMDIDTTGELSESKTSPLIPLIDWARRKFPDEVLRPTKAGFRNAYKLRLNSAPGVVSSGDAEIGTSLTFHNIPVSDFEKSSGWPVLASLVKQVENLWETPNGDEIEHAIHTWKWLFELSAGFYNELVWPEEKVYAKRKNITESKAEDILIRARVHHEAGQVYSKSLRSFLENNSIQNMDTPMLVGGEFARHPDEWAHLELFQLWTYWHSLNFEGRPDRDSHAIRICSYKILEALEWGCELKKNTGAIIWYHHQEIGRWLFDFFEEAGLNVLHCPAGPISNKSIIDLGNKDKIVLASMTAHGTGKNLQHFQNQYWVQWPRPAKTAEQTLGRTHRNGQKADELIITMNNTLDFDRLNFAACLNDSLYIHQTTGNRQKLIYGNYDPMPVIFPSMVLQERGAQVQALNQNQEKLLYEKFKGA